MMIVGLLFVLIGINMYELSLFNIDGGVNEGIDEGLKVMGSLATIGVFTFKFAIF